MNTNNPSNNGQQQPSSSSSYDIEQNNEKQDYYTTPPAQAPHYVEPEIVYGVPLSASAPPASAANNQYHASAPPLDMSVNATAPPPPTAPPQQFYASAPPKIPIVGTFIPPTSQSPTTTTAAPTSTIPGGPKLEIHTRYPIRMDACPYCNTRNMKTKAVTSPNIITCLAAGITCLFCWPLFWIPLCVDRCKSTKHYCSVCNRELDEIEPFSDCCVKQRGP